MSPVRSFVLVSLLLLAACGGRSQGSSFGKGPSSAKPDDKVETRLGLLAIGLAVATAGAVLSTLPWVIRILRTIGGSGPFEPPLALFSLVWLLLAPLLVWQIVIARRALTHT